MPKLELRITAAEDQDVTDDGLTAMLPLLRFS